MRTKVLAGVLALGLMAPGLASAQTTSDESIVLRPSQLLAIGAGVVAGSLVAQAALPTRLGTLLGAAFGGYLGNLWYTGRQLELNMSTPKL